MTYKLCFVINSLSVGGAQMMLLKLLSRIDRTQFTPEVISLTRPGDLATHFADLDIPVYSLGMQRGIPNPHALLRLVRYIQSKKPDLVQTWMYHADLLGGMAAWFSHRPPVIWNVRHSNLAANIDKKSTILAAKACALTSRYLPVRIVCCAHKACQTHAHLGYDLARMCVIPNGFDVQKFAPSTESRMSVRKELGIAEDTVVVGFVSRFHPMKDHQGFILAAALLKDRHPDVHYVLCGDDITWANKALSESIHALGLERTFHLLGRRDDVPRLTSAFDIAALSSACGEAFSNTIGEAMSCGIPCAVTDVGDAAYIVDDTGMVVPPRRADEMAAAWHQLIAMGEDRRRELGLRARQRILGSFALDTVIDQYQQLYLSTLQSCQHH